VDLLVIRHAIAEDREVFAGTGKDDSLRPLTDRGRGMRRPLAASSVW
jgi:phosphohistidine phosphatase SixA